MEFHVVYYFVALVFGINNVLAESISVDTSVGRITGTKETIPARGKQYELKTFLGIPYAKAPTGDLRWEKPIPADAFKEPFMATEFGPVCPQSDTPMLPSYKHQSEDCLSLNIYVPVETADIEQSGHAVMVFVHGGGLEMGAALSYVADKLAVLGNVIAVTINYRVGIFGFLSTGDSHIPGNMGLYDQHLALKWIHENIGAFGGDAGRVTIFGQSAGGSSVLYQALFPDNEGIFQRVIGQSGVPSTTGAFNLDPKPQFEFIAKGLGCEDDSREESIKCMRKIDSQEILKTLIDLAATVGEDLASAMFLHFVLSVDGTFFTGDSKPFEISTKVKTEQIPAVDFYRSLDLMIGYTSHDGTFLVALPGVSPITDVEAFLPSREEFTDQLIEMPLAFYFGFDVQVPSLVKSLVISQYTDWSNPNAAVANRDNIIQLWTDTFFGKGTNEFAIMHANATDAEAPGNTFFYHFSAPTSLHALATPGWVEGSNHGDELGFVFGFDEKTIKSFNESLSSDNLHEWEWELSDRVIKYWSNFAKTGDPNEPAQSDPVWPQYDMAEQIVLNIGKDMSEESRMKYFSAETNNFWMETIPTVLEALKTNQESPESIYSADQNVDGTCDSDKGCGNN